GRVPGVERGILAQGRGERVAPGAVARRVHAPRAGDEDRGNPPPGARAAAAACGPARAHRIARGADPPGRVAPRPRAGEVLPRHGEQPRRDRGRERAAARRGEPRRRARRLCHRDLPVARDGRAPARNARDRHVKLDRMRSWLSAAAALLLLAGGVTLCSHRAPIFDRQLASVKRGGFDVRVDTVGVLDAARAFQVMSQVRGPRGKIIQVADDGAAVNAGDVLVRFDPSAFEADIQKLTGEVRARDALLEVARQAFEMEKSQVHKTLDNGEYDQRAAQQELARYRAYIADLQKLAAKGYAVEGEIAQARRKEEELFTKLQKADTELSRLSGEAVHSVAKAASEVN